GIGEGNADIFGLGAVDPVAENPSAALAMRVHLPTAIAATPARCDAGNQHPVADREIRDCFSFFDDNANTLMPECAPRFNRWHISLEDVQISPADGRARNPHHDIRRTLYLRLRFFLPGVFSRPVKDECFHESPAVSDFNRIAWICSAMPATLNGDRMKAFMNRFGVDMRQMGMRHTNIVIRIHDDDVVVRASIEGNMALQNQLPIDERFDAEEVPEWRYGSELATLESVNKLGLVCQAYIIRSCCALQASEIDITCCGDNCHRQSIVDDDDHDLCQNAAGEVGRFRHLGCRIGRGMPNEGI